METLLAMAISEPLLSTPEPAVRCSLWLASLSRGTEQSSRPAFGLAFFFSHFGGASAYVDIMLSAGFFEEGLQCHLRLQSRRPPLTFRIFSPPTRNTIRQSA